MIRHAARAAARQVRWYPFQLNPAASTEPQSKVAMYMAKFGKSREQIEAMGQGMGERFKAIESTSNNDVAHKDPLP